MVPNCSFCSGDKDFKFRCHTWCFTDTSFYAWWQLVLSYTSRYWSELVWGEKWWRTSVLASAQHTRPLRLVGHKSMGLVKYQEECGYVVNVEKLLIEAGQKEKSCRHCGWLKQSAKWKLVVLFPRSPIYFWMAVMQWLPCVPDDFLSSFQAPEEIPLSPLMCLRGKDVPLHFLSNLDQKELSWQELGWLPVQPIHHTWLLISTCFPFWYYNTNLFCHSF